MVLSIITNIAIGCVIQTIKEEEDYSQEDVDHLNANSKLLGEHGVLDSHGLVSAIVSIEEKLHDEYNISITIADERAMSQTKSPFISIESLSLYIEKLITEQVRNG